MCGGVQVRTGKNGRHWRAFHRDGGDCPPYITMQRSELVCINSTLSLDYTYHRHSAPKDVVYYRCSDKHCKARLHYNKRTGEITFKNQHLPSEVHRPPRSVPCLEGDEQEDRLQELERLRCAEALPSAPARRNVTLLNAFPSEFANIQFSVETLEDAKRICEEGISQGLLTQACYTEKSHIYTLCSTQLAIQEAGICVSVQVDKHQVAYFQRLVSDLLGHSPKMDCFCLLSNDINVT